MNKRGQGMSVMMKIIVVIVLVIILAILIGNIIPIGKGTVNMMNDWLVALGLKKPPVMPGDQWPQSPLAQGYLSVWKVNAADQRFMPGPLDAAVELKQDATKIMLLNDFTIIKKLPLDIYFEQRVSRNQNSVTAPNIRLRYCAQATPGLLWGTRGDCTFTDYSDYCSDATKCSLDARGVLSVTLPGSGWYQVDIAPDGQKIYGLDSNSSLPMNPKTAVIKVKYEP
jgi:hypothetical protein